MQEIQISPSTETATKKAILKAKTVFENGSEIRENFLILVESRLPPKTLWHGLLDEAIFRPFYQIDDKGYQILGDLDKKVIAQGL